MRNPPDSKKRPRDEDVERRVSLTSLRKLEEQLGYAMSQAGIVNMEREKKGSPNGRGVNKGSSGTMIYSLGFRYNRDLLKAIASEKSFSEVSASQTIKDSFTTLKEQLNADDLRSIYDKIKDIPRANLDSHNLNLLSELKNVFLKIDRDEQLSRKNATRPLTAGEQEAKLFAESNKIISATQARHELQMRQTEKQLPKRQKTSENWWNGLTANFVPVIGEVTNNILSSSFLGNFGISFPKPEEEKLVTSNTINREEVAVFSPPAEINPPKTSLKEIDRPYNFLCRLKGQPPLESSKFSTVNPIQSSNYLFNRIELWNEKLKEFDSVPNTQEYHDGAYKGYAGDYQRCILEYQRYLQASIKKIITLKSEQSKILSGFLYLELAKVEHMVTGENAYVDDKSSFSTREASNGSWYSTKGRGLGDLARQYTNFSSSSKYAGDQVTPPYYQSSQLSNSEGLDKIKRKLYSKIPEIFRNAINLAEDSVSRGVNFVYTINVPRTVKTSDDFKLEFREKINPPTYKLSTPAQAESEVPHYAQMKKSASLTATPSKSPKPYQRDEVEKVLKKIRSGKFSSDDLVKAVDSKLDLSGGIFKRASEIDKAIGVMDRNNLSQDSSLAQEIIGYKQSFSYDSRDSGFKFGERSGENAYAYICFLGSRIKLLQEVSKHLEFSKPDLKKSSLLSEIAIDNEKLQDHKLQLKTIKKMQANLLLELARFEVGLTPKNNFNTREIFGYIQKTAINSGTPNPYGAVHAESQVQSQKLKMKEKILGRELCSHIASDRLGVNYSLDYTVPVSNPAKNPVKKELEAVIRNSRLLMGVSSLTGMTR